MAKAQHDALEREAHKRGLKGKRKDAFIYGTMKNQAKKRTGKRKPPQRSRR